MSRRFVLVAMLMGLVTIARPAAQPPASGPTRHVPRILPQVLSTLRTAHPRLLVVDDDVASVVRLVATDARARQWRDRLREQATRVLDEPVVEWAVAGPHRPAMILTARERITTLAGLFLLEGDRRWLGRATAEMRAIAALPDWNPAHFLDVAELTATMALGYDWLYTDLTVDERVAFREAIVTKGLAPGVAAIAAATFWAAPGRNTWSEVCFGGLTLGALAVAEDAPDLAASVLGAIQGAAFRAHLRRFAPDGGDVEGPGYWGYATTYLTFLLSSLDTALGHDFGLGQSEGLALTGQFRMFSIGPSGLQLNYGDTVEAPAPAPQMVWLARHYDRPEYAAHERNWLARSHTPPTIFHLLWSARRPTRSAPLPPASMQVRGIDVAILRGDWRDALSSWVSVKGGRSVEGRGHLDLGSVVIDALGERWAVDLGPDYSNLPDYFGALRWTYFRLRTESHNTLLIDGRNQNTAATAPLVGFSDDSYRAFAVVDLTEAYKPAVARVRRGVALIDGRDVLMQDELEGAASAEVVWQMATRAHVTIAGRSALLQQNGRSATLRVLEPAAATLTASPAVIPAPQTPAGVVMVRVALPVGAPTQRVVMWLSTGDRPPPPVTPLDAWR